MSGSKIQPAICFVASAFVALTMQAGLSAPAVEECKARPGLTTPRGAHWYYRVNRADKRHCWYLGRASQTAPARAAVRNAGTTAETSAETRAMENPAGAAASVPSTTAPVAPVPIAFLDSSLAAAQMRLDFDDRWPSALPAAQEVNDGEPDTLSSSYAETPAVEQAGAQMPRWPLASVIEAPPSLTDHAALRLFSFAGLLAMTLLLLAGWAAKFVTPPEHERVRDRRHAMMRRLNRLDSSGAGAPRAAAKPVHGDDYSRPRPPSDPTHNLKCILAKLMDDLRRTEAASFSGDVFRRAAGRGKARYPALLMRAAE